MKDLYLTPRGDLAIENFFDNKNCLELNFLTTKSNALVVNFFLDDMIKAPASNTALTLNFKLYKEKNDKDFVLLKDKDYIIQSIKIRLLTTIGTLLNNADIGSRLEDYYHKPIDNRSLISDLTKAVEEAISDIIPNPEITITNKKTIYTDYSDGLTIKIKSDNETYIVSL